MDGRLSCLRVDSFVAGYIDTFRRRRCLMLLPQLLCFLFLFALVKTSFELLSASFTAHFTLHTHSSTQLVQQLPLYPAALEHTRDELNGAWTEPYLGCVSRM